VADRYWVGGTGNWDGTTTTHWSATSGGAGGASVPTSADNVFFDSGSNATAYSLSVTLSTGVPCANLSVSGPASGLLTLVYTGYAFNIYGSMIFAASGLTFSGSANPVLSFLATTTGQTITTNGFNFTGAIFNGVGGSWTLQDAFSCGANGATLALYAGTLNTNGKSVSCANFSFTGSSVRSLNLGASSFALNGPYSNWTISGSNYSFSVGTSTISINPYSSGGGFAGAGLTYNNVSFNTNFPITISGANTFNNLTIGAITATPTITASAVYTLAANQIVTGALSVNSGATDLSRRVTLASSVAGTTVIITAASASLTNVDLADITGAGAASPFTGSSLGSLGNNSGITFPAAKTVYWNLAGVQNWNAVGWSSTSGGTPASANYPLPQDTAVIDNAGAATSINTQNYYLNIGTLTFANRTSAVSFITGNSGLNFYGSLSLSNAVTITGSGGYVNLNGRGSFNIASAGNSWPNNIAVGCFSGTYTLSDALTLGTSGSTFTLQYGTINLNNFNLTASIFYASYGTTRSIAFGTGQLYLTGNNVYLCNIQNTTGFSYTGSGVFNLTYSGSTGTRTVVAQGSPEAYSININVTAGSDIVALAGPSNFKNVDFTGFSGTYSNNTRTMYGNLTLSSGMTLGAGTGITTFAGTASTQLIKSVGKTIDNPITFSGSAGYQLVDGLSIGATRTVTHTAGTFNSNNKSVSIGTYSSTGSSARTISFSGSTWSVSAATSPWTVSGSNFTTTGIGKISLTSTSAKTFAGGGFYYPTINQGGTGTLTLTGANTFSNITNTVSPTTIIFPASTTTTFSDFNLNGMENKLVTIRSSIAGTKFTLLNI